MTEYFIHTYINWNLMDTEIELKYLVISDNVIEHISDLLTQKSITFTHSIKRLSNHYFDTPELNLRRHDMGLRVREVQGQFEQTIKTSGKVLGGLHQRPEYNYPISQNLPDLNMFPAALWGKNQSIDAIQSQLLAIFTTNFTRNIWLITYPNGCEIELVYDEGEVCGDGRVEPIKEIELELFKGTTDDLFILAKELFDILKLRPGIKSKAAIGYGLWQNKREAITKVPLLNLTSADAIVPTFYQGLNFHLHVLQKFVDEYLSNPCLELLGKVTDVLALLRHGFWLYEEYLPADCKHIRDELSYYIQLLSWVDSAFYLQELTNKTGNYRKKLDYCTDLITQIKIEKREFPEFAQVQALLHTARFNELQLSILKLLLAPEAPVTAEQPSTHSFAREKLSNFLAILQQEMGQHKEMTSEQYFASRKALHRSLLTGNWLGCLLNNDEREMYRAAWLDLQEGISELQALWFIQLQLQKLNEPSEKLQKWQASKVDNLLMTLDQTREHALSLGAYWIKDV